MKSLRTVGFIHPIVVTDQLELVAGARRLEAMKRLGATMIEGRRVGDLSELEQRIIELHENLDRKDLTSEERSRTQVEPASAVASH
jgi:ParB family transcriptional regulator, chromosome partitioning protein